MQQKLKKLLCVIWYMILYISTVNNDDVTVKLEDRGREIGTMTVPAKRAQAEKLLPAIRKILKKSKLELKDIEGIKVENQGGSFTSLRIGVATANALGFALGAPVQGVVGYGKKVRRFNIIEPKYSKEPDIGRINA